MEKKSRNKDGNITEHEEQITHLFIYKYRGGKENHKNAITMNTGNTDINGSSLPSLSLSPYLGVGVMYVQREAHAVTPVEVVAVVGEASDGEKREDHS